MCCARRDLGRYGSGPEEGATHLDGRLCANMYVEMGALMTAMRQVGVGSRGGGGGVGEALAIFHQLVFDDRVTGHTHGANQMGDKTASE